jgi:hypothetical protein
MKFIYLKLSQTLSLKASGRTRSQLGRQLLCETCAVARRGSDTLLRRHLDDRKCKGRSC